MDTGHSYELPSESAPRFGLDLDGFTYHGISFGIWHQSLFIRDHSLIWIAGGGRDRKDLKADRSFCTRICRATDVNVVTVDISGAWPGQCDKVVGAIRCLLTHTSYSLAGVSSGSHVVLATHARLHRLEIQMPDHVYLIAPVVRIEDLSCWRSEADPADDGNLTKQRLNTYITSTFSDVNSHDVNPYHMASETLRGLPPTTMVVFSDDILSKDAEEAHRKWSPAWKELGIRRYQGVHHLLRCDKTKPIAKELRNDIVEHIKRRHHSPKIIDSVSSQRPQNWR